MSVNPTSRKAFAELRDAGELGRQERIVVNVVSSHQPATRRQIARLSGLDLSAVCGRVHDLVERGFLEVAKKGACPITGKTVEHLRLADLGRLAVAVRKRSNGVPA